jgi:hypothetical protein
MANKKFLNPINLVNLSSDPGSANEGDIYYNTTADVVKVYANGAWVAIGAGGGSEITVSTTAPSSPATGDAWYKNDTGEFYIYDGTYWVEVNGVVTVTGDLTSIDSITYPDYITFDTTPETEPTEAGSLWWNPDVQTLNVQLDSDVTLQVGQEHVVRVKNDSGSVAIPEMRVVMFAGATGDTVEVTPALSTASYEPELLLGVTTEQIPADGFGFVTQFGFINKVDTSTPGWSLGDLLYVDPANAGLLTNVKPSAPNWTFPVAAVTRVHASTGRILVRALPGKHLHDLVDVAIDTPEDNEVLAYDDVSGVWKNQTSVEAGLLDTSATAQTKAGDLTIGGNLTVNGTTTTFNTENVLVEDNIITLNSTVTGTPSTNSGIEVERGTSDNVSLIWNETSDEWTLTNDGTTYYPVATQNGYTYDSVITIRSYDGITDGAINLEGYLNKIHLSDDNGVTIETGAGTKLFGFNNSGNITLPGSIVFDDSSSQSTAFLGISSYDTDDISEGTRLYFTDERAQDAIGNSIGAGLSYNDSTGTISNPGVLDIIGTTNEIVVSGTNTELQIGIPNSPVFVTPNIGAATATSLVVGEATIKTTTTQITSSASTTIATFPADPSLSAECLVVFTSENSGAQTISKILIAGSYGEGTVDMTEYAIIERGGVFESPIGTTLSVTISGINILLKAEVSDYEGVTAKVVSTHILSPLGAS